MKTNSNVAASEGELQGYNCLALLGLDKNTLQKDGSKTGNLKRLVIELSERNGNVSEYECIPHGSFEPVS